MTEILKKVTDCLSEADNKKLLQELGLKRILDRKELVIFLKDNLLFKDFLGDGEPERPKPVIIKKVNIIGGIILTHHDNYYYRISNDYSRSIDGLYEGLYVLLSLVWYDVKISG